MAELDAPEGAKTPQDQAVLWHARLGGDAGEAEWREFTLWLEADPQHRAAFDDLDSVLAGVEDYAAAHSTPDNVIPFRRRIFVTAGWGAGLAAIAAAIALMVLPQHPSQPLSHEWSTRIGERRDVALEDGSVIHLNTDTAVSVAFSRAARGARLDKGEALFEVSPDAKRPFTVAAGDQRVEVVGTAFNVLRANGSITVTVSHGIVRASIADTADAASSSTGAKLTAGDQYTRREQARDYTVTKVDPAAALAWREGRLFYDNADISQIVSDLNRNFQTRIVVEDEAVGRLKFSGVLKMDDEISVLHRLEGFLPVAMQTQGDRIVLKARTGG